MLDKNKKFSRVRVWAVFIALFVCGAFVGIGIANWNHRVAGQTNQSDETIIQENLTSCQAIERVLIKKLNYEDTDCYANKSDLDTYRKLAAYGCPENHDKYMQSVQNVSAILAVACVDNSVEKTCLQIEQNLQGRLGPNDVYMSADERIDRAKIYAVMAEKGCPENSSKYVELAKKELEIARGISDDKFDEQETIEAVETYKRLKMQQDAEEIFNKAKKLTNPAIDFIMQVEKIINE